MLVQPGTICAGLCQNVFYGEYCLWGIFLWEILGGRKIFWCLNCWEDCQDDCCDDCQENC